MLSHEMVAAAFAAMIGKHRPYPEQLIAWATSRLVEIPNCWLKFQVVISQMLWNNGCARVQANEIYRASAQLPAFWATLAYEMSRSSATHGLVSRHILADAVAEGIIPPATFWSVLEKLQAGEKLTWPQVRQVLGVSGFAALPDNHDDLLTLQILYRLRFDDAGSLVRDLFALSHAAKLMECQTLRDAVAQRFEQDITSGDRAHPFTEAIAGFPQFLAVDFADRGQHTSAWDGYNMLLTQWVSQLDQKTLGQLLDGKPRTGAFTCALFEQITEPSKRTVEYLRKVICALMFGSNQRTNPESLAWIDRLPLRHRVAFYCGSRSSWAEKLLTTSSDPTVIPVENNPICSQRPAPLGAVILHVKLRAERHSEAASADLERWLSLTTRSFGPAHNFDRFLHMELAKLVVRLGATAGHAVHTQFIEKLTDNGYILRDDELRTCHIPHRVRELGDKITSVDRWHVWNDQRVGLQLLLHHEDPMLALASCFYTAFDHNRVDYADFEEIIVRACDQRPEMRLALAAWALRPEIGDPNTHPDERHWDSGIAHVANEIATTLLRQEQRYQKFDEEEKQILRQWMDEEKRLEDGGWYRHVIREFPEIILCLYGETLNGRFDMFEAIKRNAPSKLWEKPESWIGMILLGLSTEKRDEALKRLAVWWLSLDMNYSWIKWGVVLTEYLASPDYIVERKRMKKKVRPFLTDLIKGIAEQACQIYFFDSNPVPEPVEVTG